MGPVARPPGLRPAPLRTIKLRIRLFSSDTSLLSRISRFGLPCNVNAISPRECGKASPGGIFPRNRRSRMDAVVRHDGALKVGVGLVGVENLCGRNPSAPTPPAAQVGSDHIGLTTI